MDDPILQHNENLRLDLLFLEVGISIQADIDRDGVGEQMNGMVCSAGWGEGCWRLKQG